MAFPTKLLNSGEEIVLDLRPHWAMLFWPEVLVILLIAATAAAAALEVPMPVLYACGVVLVVAAIWLLAKVVVWNSKNFVVTTERLIHREGVFAKQGIEIPLDRVQTIKFNQSVVERMLGAGDLLIESGGENGQNRFSDIRKPSTVQAEIYRQMEADESSRLARTGGGSQQISGAEQLEKLHGLLTAGAITQAEYDAQKARLLA